MSQKMWQQKPQSEVSASDPSQLIQLEKSQAQQRNCIMSLKNTTGQIMTFVEGQKSKIRTSSTKGAAGMLKGATEAKASHSLNKRQISKCLTQSSKRIASKGSRCQRQPQTKHLKSSTRARNTIKGRTETRTSKTAKAVLFLSWRKQRAHRQRLPRCKGNPRE